LTLALKEIPDIILCDIQLPKLNGYEVVAQLKANPQFKKIPIIAVSAYAMLDDKDKALTAGFNGFISKPIDSPNFLAQIEDFLRLGGEVVSKK
jgi:CheY-like chemotaxis protein